MGKHKRKMSIPTALIVGAIIIAIVIFGKELLIKKPQVVAESELFEIGVGGAVGESWYVVLREEINAWVGILCQAAPVFLAVMAFFWKTKQGATG